MLPNGLKRTCSYSTATFNPSSLAIADQKSLLHLFNVSSPQRQITLLDVIAIPYFYLLNFPNHGQTPRTRTQLQRWRCNPKGPCSQPGRARSRQGVCPVITNFTISAPPTLFQNQHSLENMLYDYNSTLLYVVTWSPSASSRSLTCIYSTPCRYTRASLVSRPRASIRH